LIILNSSKTRTKLLTTVQINDDTKMSEELNYFLENHLNEVGVLKKTSTAYGDVVLQEFQTHSPNGNILKHSNGEVYGIAVFNAIAEKSIDKIVELIKSRGFSYGEVEQLIDQIKLRKYIHAKTKAYKYWCSGDIGVAVMIYDTAKNIHKISQFSNQTARERNKVIREKPKDFNINRKSSSKNDTGNYFRNEYYNDSVDLDQQDSEFWDNI